MAIKSFKTIKPHIWIPPYYDAFFRVEIDEEDVTDEMISCNYTDGITETIGEFNIKIDNSSEKYTDFWKQSDLFKVYMNYSKTTNILRFAGRVTKVGYEENTVVLTGRTEAYKLMDITVTQSYENEETSEILKDLFDKYKPDFTYNNVNTTTSYLTVNWYQQSFWECVKNLCNASGFDAYVDHDFDCHFFESKSVTNSNEAVVHGSNLYEVGDFGEDLDTVRNRIFVYGSQIESFPIIYTSEDADSIAKYGVKEEIINDSGITSMEGAKELAEYKLKTLKNPKITGTVTCKLLATIQPGEMIKISDPQNNLEPKYYNIISFTQNLLDFTTELKVEKEPLKISHLMKDRINAENKLANKPNPYEMRYSWNFDFESNTGTHVDNNTEIIDGVLKTDGGSSGTWLSNPKSLDSNATKCELRINGNNLSGTYSVSSDGGNTYQEIALNSSYTLSPPGSNLKIKIELDSADTEIKGMVLLYK